MAFDIFDVGTFNRFLDDRAQPASFLLDTYFPAVERATEDVIYFDDVTRKRRLAPFVSPLVEGKVVDMPGHKTKSFRPAYVKDKRIFEDSLTLRRRPGEPVGGRLAPAQRREEAVQANLNDQLEMLTRREEWMASSALRLGQITVVGEEYPAKVVNFGRAAGHTVALTGAARWGEAGVGPLDSLRSWLSTAQSNGGGATTTVTMDPLAWGLFSKDAEVKEILNRQAYRQAPSLTDAPRSSYSADSEADVIDHGVLGEFRFFQYQSTYQDDAGAEQKMIPDYTVIMGSPGRLLGTRCYGYVRDEEAEFRAERFFVKSWRQPDPGRRFILMQSAPLVVPFRPNASFCATVR